MPPPRGVAIYQPLIVAEGALPSIDWNGEVEKRVTYFGAADIIEVDDRLFIKMSVHRYAMVLITYFTSEEWEPEEIQAAIEQYRISIGK